MSINPIIPRVAHTQRKTTPSIWGDCPWNELDDPRCLRDGWKFYEDFVNFPYAASAIAPSTTVLGVLGNWTFFTSTSTAPVAIADAALDGGAVKMGSDGNDESAVLMSGVSPFRLNTAVGKLWFECRLKRSSIAATTANFFIGFMETGTRPTAIVPLTATGALADVNLFGFLCGEGATTDNGSVDLAYKADGVTAVVVKAAAAQLVADTYMKFGLIMDPKTGLLTYYIDGVPGATTKTVTAAAGTDYPGDIGLGLVLATENGATTGSITVDWVACAQLAAGN